VLSLIVDIWIPKQILFENGLNLVADGNVSKSDKRTFLIETTARNVKNVFAGEMVPFLK
jgi:hypothetical protein